MPRAGASPAMTLRATTSGGNSRRAATRGAASAAQISGMNAAVRGAKIQQALEQGREPAANGQHPSPGRKQLWRVPLNKQHPVHVGSAAASRALVRGAVAHVPSGVSSLAASACDSALFVTNVL